jgi:hypothetical protein
LNDEEIFKAKERLVKAYADDRSSNLTEQKLSVKSYMRTEVAKLDSVHIAK